MSLFQSEEPIGTFPPHNATSEVGIDVGIAKFAACSNGEMIEGVHSFRTHEKKLSIAQRKLSKKKKYSSNWQKQLSKIRTLHQKIANVRLNFLHQCTTTLCKNHAKIVVEALKVKNMSRSSKGTREEPGRQVKAKSGLNKAILDQGWGILRRQLSYKMAWLGGIYLEVSPRAYVVRVVGILQKKIG